jgi:uncharacterized protein YecT (DUF1311 family)
MLPRLEYFLAALSFICASGWAFAQGGADAGVFFTGRWLVAEVLVNGMEERKMYYEYNDPGLRWRILNISPGVLEGNLPEIFSACAPLTVESVKMPADELLKDDMYTAWGVAHFSQYGIPVKDDEKIEVSRFKCGHQYFGESVNAAAKFAGAWTMRLDADKALMRWYDNKILVLRRLKKGEALRPSFSCAGSLGTTEKTICKVDELAGYDKSVAQAYGAIQKKFSDIKDSPPMLKFRDAQRKWIASRNKCRDDQDCIKGEMLKRLQEMSRFDPDSDPDWGPDNL